MQKIQDNRAWLLVLPVFVTVAFSAIIPLMTVVNYSVQDILGPDNRVFVGTEWFTEVLQDGRRWLWSSWRFRCSSPGTWSARSGRSSAAPISDLAATW
jgi:ABC-type sugar transport system permease subunit